MLAILVDPTDDVARVRLAQALDEHRRTLIDGVATVATGEFRQALTGNRAVATAFVDGATNIARLAHADRDAAVTALPAFQQSYENLVAANEKVSRLLATRASEANARAAYASRVRLWVVGFACLTAFIIVAAVGRIVAVSVSRALYRVRAAAHAIADGDLSVRSDAPVNDDVGAVAGAVNRMADTLKTMIARLQTEQEQDAFSRSLKPIPKLRLSPSRRHAVSGEPAMELLVADSSRAHPNVRPRPSKARRTARSNPSAAWPCVVATRRVRDSDAQRARDSAIATPAACRRFACLRFMGRSSASCTPPAREGAGDEGRAAQTLGILAEAD